MAGLFQKARMEVLYRIWDEAYVPERDDPYDSSDIPRFTPRETSPMVTRQAIKSLIEDGYLEGSINSFEISAMALTYVESQLDFPGSEIYEISEEIYSANNDARQKISSDSDWEPLPLDRESSNAAEAISKLEEITELVEADNGYAVNDPDERNFIVSALQTGLKALKEQSVIYRMQFKAFIWEPLTQLAKRFSENAIGVAAGAAKDAIKDWLKDRINDFL